MKKHTPGPWKIAERRFVYAFNAQGTNSFHASVSPGHIPGYDDEETQQANALLIAAAPDLLEALKRIIKSSACQNNCRSDDMGCDTRFAEYVIAKATDSQ